MMENSGITIAKIIAPIFAGYFLLDKMIFARKRVWNAAAEALSIFNNTRLKAEEADWDIYDILVADFPEHKRIIEEVLIRIAWPYNKRRKQLEELWKDYYIEPFAREIPGLEQYWTKTLSYIPQIDRKPLALERINAIISFLKKC